MRGWVCILSILLLAAACDSDSGQVVPATSSCGFDYDETFVYDEPPADRVPTPPPPPPLVPAAQLSAIGPQLLAPTTVAHAEPSPVGGFRPFANPGVGLAAPTPILLPGYSDTQPLFERAAAWATPTRCYETPLGAHWFTEPEAFALYQAIAERATGAVMDVTPERRNVMGIRGAYPGRLLAHANLPDRFNDTLVLLWIDGEGTPHVREFAVNTDTGAHNFGLDASSSLMPNQRYLYVNGTHRGYSALQIDQRDYPVRDDTNHNGHFDSDRNGWLPPKSGVDHDRLGNAHNIHMGSVEPPLGQAAVDSWSAGCQVIPGMASWTEFIHSSWTGTGDKVDYFLVDGRDIDPLVWQPGD